MKECQICLEMKKKFDLCYECRNLACMDCSRKIDGCPFCRDDWFGYLIDTESSDHYSLGVGKLPKVKNIYSIFGVDVDIKFTKKSVIVKFDCFNYRFSRTYKYGSRESRHFMIEFQMKQQELIFFKDSEYIVVNAQNFHYFHSGDRCQCGC